MAKTMRRLLAPNLAALIVKIRPKEPRRFPPFAGSMSVIAIFHQLHRWHAASAFRNVAIAVKNNKLFIHKRPAEFIKRRADAPTLRRVI